MHRGMVGGLLLLMTGALPCAAAAQECAWTVRQLTSSEFSTGNQTISGDGHRLALSRFDGSPIPFIHLVDASTGRMRNVAAPAWLCRNGTQDWVRGPTGSRRGR